MVTGGGIPCICQKMGRCLRVMVFSIVPVSPLRLEIKNLPIKPHHFRCLRSRLLECVLLVSARNHVFFILFPSFFQFLLKLFFPLCRCLACHSLLLDSRFLQLHLGVTYFQTIGAVCSPPPPLASLYFWSGNLKFGKLVTGEVPSEACEGGDPVTLTSSQLGKGNRNVI